MDEKSSDDDCNDDSINNTNDNDCTNDKYISKQEYLR